jgi:apolipoprotein N-acyltransferase
MRRVPLGLWGLAVLSGVLQVLPFPIAGPVPLWRTHVCWVALVPLLWALLGKSADGRPIGRVQGAVLGYASGFFWYLGSCYWVYQTMHVYGALPEPVAAMILVLFCLYLGLYHAMFGALVATVRGSRFGRQGALLLVPVLWVATELARARITGFPWDLLGMTQVDNPMLRQLAPWTGVCGISFAIAAVNALWLLRISVRERRWTRPVLAVGGVAVMAAYAVAVLYPRSRPEAPGEWATATLLQENLDVGAVETEPRENERQLLEQFAALSRRPVGSVLSGMPEMAGTRTVRRQRTMVLQLPEGTTSLDEAFEPTDLVVWPESPAPFREAEPEFRTAMGLLARQMGVPVIVGNIGLDKVPDQTKRRGYDAFNSASFLRPDGSFAGRYDKMHLVPFGEYVPYKALFFFASSLLQQVGTFEPGAKRGVFAGSGHSYGTFICYESIFGDEIREFSKMGAEVLVNISNDGWYGDTSAPWQHLNMVRMRAIENHRWVLRATNTGITSVIDPDGRVVAAAPRHVRTAIRVAFGYEHDVTFYARHGDLLPWACALLTVGAVAFAEWSRRTAIV